MPCRAFVARLLKLITDVQMAASVFLAIKYASAAMKVTDPLKGKVLSGGSIILTASGKCYICLCRLDYTHTATVAGLRSGAGTVDCEPYLARISLIYFNNDE